ncbi:MAG: cellulase family glycosylhydrolase [Chloroflexi bacterium]|nr:cellulase family glycosylhydrolase [Chloroflexota bacterium]
MRWVLPVLIVAMAILPPQSARRAASATARAGPLGYGVSVADLANSAYVSDLGFGYMKVGLSWARSEFSKGDYAWNGGRANDADNIANAAQGRNLQLLIRVDGAPAWENGVGGTAPPSNLNDFGDFLYALASHLRGKVTAYEIWNEPNLASEWGGGAPDPGRYAQMLQAVYGRIKAGDPNALVVTAGLATNGEHGGFALDDLDFIQQMYNAGARGYFDVLGSHPYGFAYPPEYDPGAASGLAFRRAEQQYAVMAANGDGGKPIWATEFGWLLDTGCDWPDRNWQKVGEPTQADYLVRAFNYALANWSWMGAMFVFNLDFGADYYQAGCPGNTNMCNPMRYYSLTYRDNPCSPGTNAIKFRLAYSALKSMPKSLPPTAAVASLATYQRTISFTVSWSGTDRSGTGIQSYDVQYKLAGGNWQDWLTQTTAMSASFAGGQGQTYYFQSRATDNAGDVGTYAGGNGDAVTTVDAIAPTSSMVSLSPTQARTWFRVAWQGSDSPSGIASSDLQFKEGSSGAWRSWLTGTTSTSSLFLDGTAGRTYYFRVRATDNAGNVRPFPSSSSAWTSTIAGPDGGGLSKLHFPLTLR